MREREMDLKWTSLCNFMEKGPQRDDLKFLPQSLCLNPDKILLYNAWKNPLLVGEAQWRSLPWINKLIEDLIMQLFPVVFFPPELWCFFWLWTGLQHSVSLIQSCSPSLLNNYTKTVLTFLSHVFPFGSQPQLGSDERAFATGWINLIHQPQEFLEVVCSWEKSS